jgi:putative FmdB family regulatory protein
MPIYEYCCPECGKRFEALVSVHTAEKGQQPACPHCGEPEVIRIFSRFATGTSRSPSSGSGCPPSAGPSCCG